MEELPDLLLQAVEVSRVAVVLARLPVPLPLLGLDDGLGDDDVRLRADLN